jgi:hypothetical protein
MYSVSCIIYALYAAVNRKVSNTNHYLYNALLVPRGLLSVIIVAFA